MGGVSVDFDVDEIELPDPICEFCGGLIEEPGQRCGALDDGRCQP